MQSASIFNAHSCLIPADHNITRGFFHNSTPSAVRCMVSTHLCVFPGYFLGISSFFSPTSESRFLTILGFPVSQARSECSMPSIPQSHYCKAHGLARRYALALFIV
jgi:hypothetical protein